MVIGNEEVIDLYSDAEEAEDKEKRLIYYREIMEKTRQQERKK